MRDLEDPRLMYLKAVLLLLIGILCLAWVAMSTRDWTVLAVVLLAVWAFCRAYYFAFYVIERYIDPGFRFDGLISMLRYVLRRRGSPDD